MLSTCNGTDKPFVIGSRTTGDYYAGTQGETPSDSCRAFALSVPNSYGSANDHDCATAADLAVRYPVIQVCRLPDVNLRASADDYSAISLIFASILVAACLVWGAKQILNLLRNRPEA